MFILFVNLIFLAAIGPPVEDIQGAWCVKEGKVREPGADTWQGFRYGEGAEPLWRVKGTRIEVIVSHTDKKGVKWLASDPKAFPIGGPTGVRFVDDDGVNFTGSYELKDGKITLTLSGWAPIAGTADTEGTKYLIIQLERPLPLKPAIIPIGPQNILPPFDD